MNKRRHWFLTLGVIATVVAISVAIALNYSDKPGFIPLETASDGSGGAITAWQNNTGIFLQRINASGQPLWTEGGIQLGGVKAKIDPYGPRVTYFTLTADGTGGAILTWDDMSSRLVDQAGPIPFYSQRISSSGEFLWKDTIVATGSYGRHGVEFPRVFADGTGGTIFAWNNSKPYFKGLHDDFLRVQKISPDGRRLWGDEGKLVVSSSPYREVTTQDIAAGIKGTITRSWPTWEGLCEIASDGAGGVIIVWSEEIANNRYKTYAQHLNNNGNPAWPERVEVGDGSYLHESLKSDGEGGAYLVLFTGRIEDAYVQHIGSEGKLLETSVYLPDTINDGLGGKIRIHIENEPPLTHPLERRNLLYVQRLNESGKSLWPEKLIFTTPDRQQFADLEYIADGTGGVIFTWQLQKEGPAYGQTFAQRVDAEGNIRWAEEGLPVFSVPGIRYYGNAKILSDGSRGVLVIAVAGESALGGDMVYAQRLDADGNRLWGNGVRIDR